MRSGQHLPYLCIDRVFVRAALQERRDQQLAVGHCAGEVQRCLLLGVGNAHISTALHQNPACQRTEEAFKDLMRLISLRTTATKRWEFPTVTKSTDSGGKEQSRTGTDSGIPTGEGMDSGEGPPG